ncbi:metalloregulator ArsR/SmtB family transcription factor [Pelagibius sp. Alg239-R121]|uniref:helix-turn-helix transcriptional regulator n=1 Tax=Pelagibius sp. Alg239-R121 TaxID=2993448 RepID=UPI0024A72B4D|nr:metalloregulator ArsR/SmtB family transcription factor [Pelagibius sp. Alg239-R121]
MADQSEDRILFFLKRHGLQTAAVLGERLGMTSVGARQHLHKLKQNDLVVSEDRRENRGRPKKYWRLTEKGHGRFPDRHADLTLELITSTREVFGAEGLERLIKHREQASLKLYRSRLANCRSLKEKASALVEVRSQEGYMAECHEEDGGSLLFIENHCPICAAAGVCQSLCRSELQIFQNVLGEDARVERLEHILAGARRCAYRILPNAEC